MFPPLFFPYYSLYFFFYISIMLFYSCPGALYGRQTNKQEQSTWLNTFYRDSFMCFFDDVPLLVACSSIFADSFSFRWPHIRRQASWSSIHRNSGCFSTVFPYFSSISSELHQYWITWKKYLQVIKQLLCNVLCVFSYP